MKKSLFLAVAMSLLPVNANAQGVVLHDGSHGHVDSNGTLVAPHMQTNPNITQLDSSRTRGNIDPHTGEVGTPVIANRSPR